MDLDELMKMIPSSSTNGDVGGLEEDTNMINLDFSFINSQFVSPSPPVSITDSTLMKKEKRRTQIRNASRRCRQKQKEELESLRRQVGQLESQVYALKIEKKQEKEPPQQQQPLKNQIQMIQSLQEQNTILAYQLDQHVEFLNRIQSAFGEISHPMAEKLKSNLRPPWLLSSVQIENYLNAIDHTCDALLEFSLPDTDVELYRGSSMTGWEVSFWQKGTAIHMQCEKVLSHISAPIAAQRTFSIFHDPEKSKKYLPEVVEMKTLQQLSPNAVMSHRIESFAELPVFFNQPDTMIPIPMTQFVSLIFLHQKENEYVVANKSIPSRYPVLYGCQRGEEENAFIFTQNTQENTTSVRLVGTYDVKQEMPDLQGGVLLDYVLQWVANWEESITGTVTQ